jgi:hypothetical protein
VGCSHGREITGKKERQGFFYLAGELEKEITSNTATLNTLTTQGVSLSGDLILLTMRELTTHISNRTGILLTNIRDAEHNLTILKGQYYKYALKVNLELKFSQQAEDVFSSFRFSADKNLINYAPESLRRLAAAYENLHSDNSESWSQALTSCRRVFQELSDSLFNSFITNVENGNYQTSSGKVFSVSGENYKNRLYAVVDFLSKSKTSRNLIGSEIMYLIDWIDCFHDLLSKGVHEIEEPIEYEEARFGILHTYMLLGNIANLLSKVQEGK